MSRSLHPPCAGSQFYGPHSAKVPAAYTVIAPGGDVLYTCDTDCLQRVLERRASEAIGRRPAPRKLARRAAS